MQIHECTGFEFILYVIILRRGANLWNLKDVGGSSSVSVAEIFGKLCPRTQQRSPQDQCLARSSSIFSIIPVTAVFFFYCYSMHTSEFRKVN